MPDRRPPRWARGLSRLVPAEYRADVLADLVDERSQRIAQGRSRVASAWWLAGHLLRSAVASRRQEPVIMDTGSRFEILRGFPRELRRAARGLLRAPLFAAVAIAMIALGIGATTAIFTVLDAVVLRPLPYADPGRLVAVMHPTAAPGGSGARKWGMSSAGYFEFKREAKSFSDMGGYRTSSYAVSGDNAAAEDASVAQVTASILTTLGARPFRGRLINEDDDRPGAPPVVVLGYAFWERRYGRDESIVNRSIRTAAGPRLVVGVAEPGLSLPKPGPFASTANLAGFGVDVWEPLRLNPNARPQNSHQYSGIARLKAGVSAEEAQAELSRITGTFPERFPTAYSAGFIKSYSFRVSVTPLHEEVLGPTVARSLWILFVAIGFVLLIACANVANLIIVRATGRERETGIRAALGASRVHLVVQSLAESLVLTGISGLGAVAIAYWGVPALLALAPTDIPLLASSTLDWRAILFAAGVSVAAGVVFALIPLVRQPARAPVLGGTGRGLTASRRQQMLRGGLVMGQVALAVLLLAAAGLLVRSVDAMKRVKPGLDPAGVLTFDVSLPYERYALWQTAMNFHRELHDRIAALPGVTHVGGLTALPLRDIGTGCTVVFREARPFTKEERTPCVPTEAATPGLFAALAMRVNGRVPTWQDVDSRSQAAVITKALADRLWPGEDPIGKGINSNGNPTAPPELWYRIVGVVPELRAYTLDGPPAEAVFYAATNLGKNDQADSMQDLVYVVKTDAADPMSLVPGIRSIVSSLDNDVPVAHPNRMTDIVARSMARASFVMLLLSMAAALAIVLSAVGLYGVIAYAVAERRVEIGIRMALGASVTQVGRRVVGQSVALAAGGAAVGIGLAVMTTRLLDSYLFGVDAIDPAVFAVAVVTLLAVACVASAAPARRAARVNPVEAIRN
jgi:putative ABC transport system permease protein